MAHKARSEIGTIRRMWILFIDFRPIVGVDGLVARNRATKAGGTIAEAVSPCQA